MWKSIGVVTLGAGLGALLRWALGTRLNGLLPTIPIGTLLANLLGSYIIGIALAYFAQRSNLTPALPLFIVTGFCGGLTTFSTFSAEVVSLLQQGRLAWAMLAISLHVMGSLGMTLLGLASYSKLKMG